MCIEKEQGAARRTGARRGADDAWSATGRAELARFAPHLRVVVLHGPERHARWKDVPSADVVVTTYPVVVRDEERFASQRFSRRRAGRGPGDQEPQSQARRAVERVRPRTALCLTGTPVENHLGELWSIFDWLSPGLLGDQLQFRRFWRQPVERRGDAERLAALREVVAPYVLRRLKRDVAKELPPKTELELPVELGPEQRELYEAIRVAAHGDVRKAIRAKGVAASSVAILDALTKLRQVCCDPRLVAMNAARGVRESAKLDALLELLGEQLAAGTGVLLFSQFTSMLALVAESLRGRETPTSCSPARRASGSASSTRSRKGGPTSSSSASRPGHGAQPDQRRHRRALRPVVEPRRAGAGDRPRLPHRPDEARLRSQPLRGRERRGAGPRLLQAPEALALVDPARGRPRRRAPGRGRHRRPVRAHRCRRHRRAPDAGIRGRSGL